MTDTTNKAPQIAASSEIMGAALTAGMSGTEILAFGADPKSFIASSLSVDTGDVTLSVVENGVDTINLALPYYSALDQLAMEAVTESDLDGVSGGEIIISLIIVGAVATVGVVSATIAVAAKYYVDSKDLPGHGPSSSTLTQEEGATILAHSRAQREARGGGK